MTYTINKGLGSYSPKRGERVLISPPNSGYGFDFEYFEYTVYHIDEDFIVYGNKGYYPNVNRIEHVHIKPLIKE